MRDKGYIIAHQDKPTEAAKTALNARFLPPRNPGGSFYSKSTFIPKSTCLIICRYALFQNVRVKRYMIQTNRGTHRTDIMECHAKPIFPRRRLFILFMNIQKVQITERKPDCCRECRLLGIVPKGYPSPKYSKKTFLCLGALKAMTEDKIGKRESRCTDPKHPLKRPCDEHYDRWLTNQNRIVCVNKALYRDSRDPYLAMIYPTIDFED